MTRIEPMDADDISVVGVRTDITGQTVHHPDPARAATCEATCTIRAEEARSQSTAYLWIGLAFFMIGGVTGSYYMNMMNIIDAPYVGP